MNENISSHISFLNIVQVPATLLDASIEVTKKIK